LKGLKIGELAAETGIPVETIRYYEREGLLPEPKRSGSNYRLYGNTHVERLKFIRDCRLLDMSLEETRRLLRFRDAPDEDCGEVGMLLEEHIAHVTERIQELKSLEKQLKSLRNLCMKNQAAKDCGILRSLGTSEEKTLRKRHAHCSTVKRTHR